MNDNIKNWQEKISDYEKLSGQMDNIISSCDNLTYDLNNCKTSLDENKIVNSKSYDDGVLKLDLENCSKISSSASAAKSVCKIRIEELQNKISAEKIRLEREREEMERAKMERINNYKRSQLSKSISSSSSSRVNVLKN